MMTDGAAGPHFSTAKPERIVSLDEEVRFIERLVSKGGPSPADYPALGDWFQRVQDFAVSEDFTLAERLRLSQAFGEAMSPATLQGLGYHQPHGYAGDFEVIDKIYVRHHSPNPRLVRWDAYFHSQPPSRAVRNRKTYLHTLLDRHYARRRPLRVLNLASGSGRCMFEWLSANPSADVSFSCVELDPDAIMYVLRLIRNLPPGSVLSKRTSFAIARPFNLI